jgi:hypothetical protein
MDKHIHKQGEIYDNEEDRRNGLLEAKRRYANQPWLCIPCNILISRGGKTNHENSERHRRNFINLKN